MRNKKLTKEKSFFKNKKTTAVFGIVSLFGGFLFLDSGLTGNAILNKQSPINLISIAGLLLIFCSAVLIAHSLRK